MCGLINDGCTLDGMFLRILQEQFRHMRCTVKPRGVLMPSHEAVCLDYVEIGG